MDQLAQARALYANGRLREASSLLSEMIRRSPGNPSALQLLGVIQFRLGFQREGLKLAEKAVASDPNSGEAWNGLGLMRHLMGDSAGALEAFTNATSVTPGMLEAWKNLGFMLQAGNRQEEALAAFARAGDSPDVRFFRGNSLAVIGAHEEAVREFDAVLAVQPDNGDAWHNRANSLLALDRIEEALESFGLALRRLGRVAGPHCSLAIGLRRAGRTDEALSVLAQVLQWEPGNAQALALQQAFKKELEELDDLARGLAEHAGPGGADRVELARHLQAQGKWEAAISTLKHAEGSGARFLEALLMPPVFDSGEMAQESLNHLRRGVAALLESPPPLEDPLREVGITTFHLPYYGVSDRSLQESIGRLYREAAPSLRFEAAHTPHAGERIRLGVLSAYLREHTVSRVFGGIVERLDREKFELVYFQIGPSDAYTERLTGIADKHVRLSPELATAREEVAREELDILFYPELGMDPLTYFLAYSRLAPVQCTTWGHPFTSGSPVVDHYVSSRDLESEQGDGEYTEELTRLQSLGIWYEKPVSPPAWDRSDFELPENRTLYGCPQMAYKLHPSYDSVLAQILARDPNGVLVLPEPQHAFYREILLKRWASTHPIIAERVVWMPQMALPQFLRLLQVCDALLTPIQFGGGRSTLDALGVGSPVVTLKGPFLKSRISYAIYKAMGMEDLIAATEDEYVELAHRLGVDREWRHEMRLRVSSRSHVLYQSRPAVDEWNAFLTRIAPA